MYSYFKIDIGWIVNFIIYKVRLFFLLLVEECCKLVFLCFGFGKGC